MKRLGVFFLPPGWDATTSDKTCWDTLQEYLFFHSPDKNAYCRKLKECFPPSPIAMLFAETQEVHAWAAKPKQHCTRGGEGGEFVSFGHDGTVVQNWKLYWNILTVLSGVVVHHKVTPGSSSKVAISHLYCTPGWREVLWEKSVMPRTHCSVPG